MCPLCKTGNCGDGLPPQVSSLGISSVAGILTLVGNFSKLLMVPAEGGVLGVVGGGLRGQLSLQLLRPHSRVSKASYIRDWPGLSLQHVDV